jgi:hypothetical protein
MCRSYRLNEPEACGAFQDEIEEDDIGAQAFVLQERIAVVQRSDNGNIGLTLQQHSQTFAQKAVILDNS